MNTQLTLCARTQVLFEKKSQATSAEQEVIERRMKEILISEGFEVSMVKDILSSMYKKFSQRMSKDVETSSSGLLLMQRSSGLMKKSSNRVVAQSNERIFQAPVM